MKKLSLAFLLLCWALAPAAFASTFDPISVISGGTFVADLLNQPTFAGTNPAGTLSTAVYKGDANNTAVASDPNALTFVYQFVQTSTSDISSISVPGFGNSIVGANWGAGSCSTCFAPFFVDPALGEATWYFSKSESVGKTTDYLIVYTNADTYSNTVAQLNDSSNSRADALATVPEPASLALFGSGLLGLAGFARRRFLK